MTKDDKERYKVLIDITDDKSGKRWRPGQYLTADDIPQSVISVWLKNDPPVLARVEDKDNGRDA